MANEQKDLLQVLTEKIEKLTTQELAQSQHLIEHALELQREHLRISQHVKPRTWEEQENPYKQLVKDFTTQMQTFLTLAKASQHVTDNPAKVVVNTGTHAERTVANLERRIAQLERKLADALNDEDEE